MNKVLLNNISTGIRQLGFLYHVDIRSTVTDTSSPPSGVMISAEEGYGGDYQNYGGREDDYLELTKIADDLERAGFEKPTLTHGEEFNDDPINTWSYRKVVRFKGQLPFKQNTLVKLADLYRKNSQNNTTCVSSIITTERKP